MKKKISRIGLLIVLGILVIQNVYAYEENLNSLYENESYSSVDRLIINDTKNLDILSSMSFPNLTKVTIKDTKITDSKGLIWKQKLNQLVIKNTVINMDNLDIGNIETVKVSNSYVYGNSDVSKEYAGKGSLRAEYHVESDYDEEITKIAKSLYKEGMTDEEKVKAVTMYVINHLKYDLNTVNNGKTPAQNSLSGKGVCSTYSYLESQLLNKLGVFTLDVTGYTNVKEEKTGKSTYHAWVAVYMNDKWYFIDPTWIDRNGNSNKWSTVKKNKYYLEKVEKNGKSSTHYPDFTLFNSIPKSEKKSKMSILEDAQETVEETVENTIVENNAMTDNKETVVEEGSETNTTEETKEEEDQIDSVEEEIAVEEQEEEKETTETVNIDKKEEKKSTNTEQTEKETSKKTEKNNTENSNKKEEKNNTKEQSVASTDENSEIKVPNTSSHSNLEIMGLSLVLGGIVMIRKKHHNTSA